MVQNEFPGDAIADRIIEAAVIQLHDCWDQALNFAELADRIGVEPETISSIYPDSPALIAAVQQFGVARLSDRINRELIAAAPDAHSKIEAIAWAYLGWARDNPRLYTIITRPPNGDNSVARSYDASFIPLVRRFIEGSDVQLTRKLTVARCLMSGITQVTLSGHFDLWMTEGGDYESELKATISDGVRMLLAAQPEG